MDSRWGVAAALRNYLSVRLDHPHADDGLRTASAGCTGTINSPRPTDHQSHLGTTLIASKVNLLETIRLCLIKFQLCGTMTDTV